MRTIEEIRATAVAGRPFSNGTEGYGWMESHCDVCVHDAAFQRTGEGKGCPILYVAMAEDATPAEWTEEARDEQGRYSIANRYECSEFVEEDEPGEDDDPKPEPGPDPVHEDQLDILGLIVDEQILPQVETIVPVGGVL